MRKDVLPPLVLLVLNLEYWYHILKQDKKIYTVLFSIVNGDGAMLFISWVFPQGGSKKKQDDINGLVEQIQQGDTSLKDRIIIKYRPFIIKCISKVTGRYVDTSNSDEYSIGLMAFSEAIDGFHNSGKGSFFSFAELVIKRRVIDYLRKKSRTDSEYPFTYFDSNGQEDTFEEKYLSTDSDSQYEQVEIREQIEELEKQLERYGFDFEDLADSSPSHRDTRQNAIHVAGVLADREELFAKLDSKKKIPMKDLRIHTGASRRTIEGNRKFIIAVTLILRSELDVLKQYVINAGRGGDGIG